MGLRQNTAVINIHVGLSDVSYRNQPFQYSIFPYCRDGCHIILLHDVPRFFKRNVIRHSPGFSYLNVLYLGSHILHQLWLIHAKVIEDKLSLPVDMSRSCRHILPAC